MSVSKFLSIALLTAAVQASPLVKAPSRVLPRGDPPAPSTYPLGDACQHEWQYLNFNTDDGTDKTHLQTLHNVICSGEMRAVSSSGQFSAEKVLKPYKRYFPKNDEDDEDDDVEGHVKSVLGLIAGTSSTDGMIGSVVGNMIIDNLDFAVNIPGADNCGDTNNLGYTLTDTVDDREKIHFCDPSWTRPAVADIDCRTLDPYPSEKMGTFSRIALHEMTHYSTVGPASSLGEQIVDGKNDDGNPTYDPSRVHAYLTQHPELTENNADSFAWMALDSYISLKCSPNASGDDFQDYFTQDPPDY